MASVPYLTNVSARETGAGICATLALLDGRALPAKLRSVVRGAASALRGVLYRVSASAMLDGLTPIARLLFAPARVSMVTVLHQRRAHATKAGLALHVKWPSALPDACKVAA